MEVGSLRVLPSHVAVFGGMVAILCLIRLWRAESSPVIRFLVVALWFRYMAAEFPSITFQSVGGVSIISLVSLSTVGIGVMILGFRIFQSPIAYPCYILIAVNIVSGLFNGYMGGAIDSSIKSIYFLVIAAAVCEAFLKVGTSRLSSLLVTVLTVPLAFQFVGFVFGVAKASEADGSASVIGGYNHESGFSMVSLTFILVAGIHALTWKKRGLGLMTIGAASIVLANYRTSLLAALPIMATILFTAVARGIKKDQQILTTIIMLPLVAILCILVMMFQDRFVDLFAAAGDFDQLFVLPDHFTVDARRLLSGRPYIWSMYISEYIKGSDLQLLIGYGPDSWGDSFRVYAHNTLVGALYDLGIFGFFASLIFLLSFLIMSARSLQRPSRMLIVFAYCGFFVLNMSTMPLWSIEGLIFYSILVGLSFSEARRVAPGPARQLARRKSGLPGRDALTPLPGQALANDLRK